MIDVHCHLLPGLDDGATSTEEALSMAAALAGAGFKTVCCTPHCIRGAYDNKPTVVRREVARLQQRLDKAGIALRLQPGMEYYLDEFFPKQLEDPQPLGDSKLLLAEIPTQADPERIKELLFLVRRKGLIPLLAHPERSALLKPEPQGNDESLLRKVRSLVGRRPEPQSASFATELRAMDVLFQGNLGSFAGFYGTRVKEKARAMLRQGLYDQIGSDGHTSRGFDQMLSSGLKTLREENADAVSFLPQLTRWTGKNENQFNKYKRDTGDKTVRKASGRNSSLPGLALKSILKEGGDGRKGP